MDDDSAEKHKRGRGAVLVTEGEWAGWYHRQRRGTYEELSGPFYWRDEPSGRRCAFRAEPKHMNGAGFMHGGCLMTFADFALFTLARQSLDRPGVTATLNGEFMGSARVGDLVECTGEVVKGGRALVFVRGLVTCGEQPLLTWSGVIKKVSRT